MSERSDAPRLGRLNHIGIVVRDLSSSEATWRRLFGLPPAGTPPLAAAGVEYTALDIGGLTLELIQPRSTDTSYADFLKQHGEGVHHLCFEVNDLEAWRRTDAAAGSAEVAVRSADGRAMIDLPPGASNGVSIQVCQLMNATQ
jgi:methylmalonyl-CoA/ethylmalonyl-CoA epimerase